MQNENNHVLNTFMEEGNRKKLSLTGEQEGGRAVSEQASLRRPETET